MRWRIPLVVALVAFVVVGCDQQPVEPPSGATVNAPSFKAEPSHSKFVIEDSFTGFIECGADELVDFTVKGMCQWQQFYDANGGFHSQGTCSVHGKGIGQTSGSKWIFSEAWPSTMHIGPNGDYPYVYNDVYVNKWQGTGGAPSWNDWYKTKYTINANGEVTVEIESHRYVCEGL